MKILNWVVVPLLGLSMFSCQQVNKVAEKEVVEKTDSLVSKKTVGDNSQVSVDWEGQYQAILPCADCPGIVSDLTLNKDQTFTLSEKYMERDIQIEDRGSFTWDENGQKITLNGKEAKGRYLVGENQLFKLDEAGEIIKGELKNAYVYKKK